MYAIIYWIMLCDRPKIILKCESDGEIKVFKTLNEADDFANALPCSENCRVISLEGVEE